MSELETMARHIIFSLVFCCVLGFFAPVRAQTAGGLQEADRLFALAMSNWARSTSPDVERMLLRALALRQGLLPATDPRVAQAQNQLGRVYYNRGLESRDPAQFGKATDLFARSVEGVQASLGNEHLVVGQYLADLAASLREQGRYREAIPHACGSLKIRHALLPHDAGPIARILDSLSRCLAGLSEDQDARALQEDVNRLVEGKTGADDPGGRALDRYCSPLVS